MEFIKEWARLASISLLSFWVIFFFMAQTILALKKLKETEELGKSCCSLLSIAIFLIIVVTGIVAAIRVF